MNGISEKFRQFQNGDFAKKVKAVLSSRYLSFFTAIVIMICYYASLDLLAMYYLSALFILMLVFLDDLSPLIANFLFIGVLISDKNSPSKFLTQDPSDFYYRTHIVVQMTGLMILIIAMLILRLILNIRSKKFKCDSVFFGLAAFGAVLVLNGVFCERYNPMDLAYGVCLAGLFFGIFTVLKDSVEINENSLKTIAFGFVALAALITFELFLKYLTNEDIIKKGIINRLSLGFGWGMYNTIGAYLLLCAPFPFYLSTKYKYGYWFFILGLIFLAATVLTFSRQAWGGAFIVYSACVLVTLIKEKGHNKWIEVGIIACVALVVLIMAFIYWNDFIELVKNLFKGIFSGQEFSGNGRKGLWEEAIYNFKNYPAFGVGFFSGASSPDFDGLTFVPEMYHNTYMQLLSSCGILGLLGYVAHRGTTVFSFIKNITFERILIVIDIAGLLAINFVDNHLFYLYPTLIYSCLIVMLVKSESCGQGLNLIDKFRRKKKEQ